jgi:hypothetical protein
VNQGGYFKVWPRGVSKHAEYFSFHSRESEVRAAKIALAWFELSSENCIARWGEGDSGLLPAIPRVYQTWHEAVITTLARTLELAEA